MSYGIMQFYVTNETENKKEYINQFDSTIRKYLYDDKIEYIILYTYLRNKENI